MKRLFLTVVAVALLTVAACAQDITVGVVLSLTGPGAALGIPNKNAMSLAPTTVAGHKVNYVTYDDASDPTMAVQVVKRLIAENKVDVIIGTTITPTALAVIDLVAEANTPLISLAQSASVVSPVDAKRKWVFKTPADEAVYMRSVAQHMAKHGVKTVSTIAFDDAYGEGNFAGFKAEAQRLNIKILATEKYKRTDTSALGQVLRAMQVKPDAVFILASGTPAALPHKELVERGYKGKIYQTAGVVNPDFLRVGGKDVEGAFLPASPLTVAEQLPNGYPTKAESLRFAHAYEPKFGSRQFFAALAWDAMNIVNNAIPKALATAKPGTIQFRQALRNAIENTKGYNGATAVFTFSPTDHAGVNQLGSVMARIENGGWKLVEAPSFK